MRKLVYILIIIVLSILIVVSVFFIKKYEKQIQKSNKEIANLNSTVLYSNKQVTAEDSTKIYPIDIVLEKCMAKNYSTAGMNNCTITGINAWNKEIKKHSEQIVKHLDKENVELFKETQNSWENYCNKEKEFLINSISQKNGTIHTTIATGKLYDLNKQRALWLKSVLTDLIN